MGRCRPGHAKLDLDTELGRSSFAGVTLFLGVMFIQRGQAIFLYFNF